MIERGIWAIRWSVFMKKYFLILFATMALVACNDETDFSMDRDVESYTIEELQNLSEGFDVTKINQDQLLADLTEGAIWAPYYKGTWSSEIQDFEYNPVLGGGYENAQWIFDADGKAVNVTILYEDHIPRWTYSSHAATWRYESETGEIVILWSNDSKEFRLKVLYYKSPVLYFSQKGLLFDHEESFIVNLRQYTKTQAEAEMNKLIEKQ